MAGGVQVRRDQPLGRAEEVGQLALVGDGLVDRVLGVHRLVVRLFLLPLKITCFGDINFKIHAVWFIRNTFIRNIVNIPGNLRNTT